METSENAAPSTRVEEARVSRQRPPRLEQLGPLEGAPMLKLYRASGGVTTVVLFSAAVEPLPEDIDLEDYDESDDEDAYDWYTFARALDGRVDEPTAALLKTAAFALKPAADAGAGPAYAEDWGGVFGSEHVAAFDLFMAAALGGAPAEAGPHSHAHPHGCSDDDCQDEHCAEHGNAEARCHHDHGHAHAEEEAASGPPTPVTPPRAAPEDIDVGDI